MLSKKFPGVIGGTSYDLLGFVGYVTKLLHEYLMLCLRPEYLVLGLSTKFLVTLAG